MRLTALKGIVALFGTVAMVATLPSAQAQNLVVNGDFEANIGLSPNSYGYFNSIPGWKTDTTKQPGKIEIQRENIAGTTPDGYQFLELDSNRSSYVYQDITTTAGKDYTVTFIYSKRKNVQDNGFEFHWDNESKTTVFNLTGTNNANPYWFSYSGIFKASSPLTRIAFENFNRSDSYGGYIDKVSVTAVPEPGEIATMAILLGVVGLGIVRGRSQQTAKQSA